MVSSSNAIKNFILLPSLMLTGLKIVIIPRPPLLSLFISVVMPFLSVLRSRKQLQDRLLKQSIVHLPPYVTEVLWIINLLHELKVSRSTAPQIFCDNIGATYLSVNPVFNSWMKHIAIDYYFVRDHVAKGSLVVSHVSIKDQLADPLTKLLPAVTFKHLRSKIGISNGSTILQGANQRIVLHSIRFGCPPNLGSSPHQISRYFSRYESSPCSRYFSRYFSTSHSKFLQTCN